MSGTITKPPPYDSAPTLNATQTSGATLTGPEPGSPRRSASSAAPAARSTSTSHGPIVAAATPPAATYAPHRMPLRARAQLAGTSDQPAWTATAATAAPAPAPAPRIQRGG